MEPDGTASDASGRGPSTTAPRSPPRRGTPPAADVGRLHGSDVVAIEVEKHLEVGLRPAVPHDLLPFDARRDSRRLAAAAAYCGTDISSRTWPSGSLKYTPRPPFQSLSFASSSAQGALPKARPAACTRCRIASNSASLT